MIITCQECDSRFVLDDKLIKPTGSKVRCSSCKHVFKVFPETAVPSPEEPQALTPEPAPAPPPEARPPRELDAGDDLANELDRELDRLFGPDDGEGEAFFEDTPEADAAPPAAEPEVPPLPEKAPAESIEDISLDDLGLDDFDLAEEPGAGVPEDLDLSDLDLDLSLDDEMTPVPAVAGGEEADEELDFSDLEASLSGEDLAAPGGEEEFDFADIDLTLDESGSLDTPAVEPPVEDLDFSDLEAAPEAPGAPEEELDFSDFALSLDDGSGDVALQGEEELDLSLDEGDVEAVSFGGSGELELTLDEGGYEAAPLAEGSGQEDGFMDLELDLELDDEEPMEASLGSSLNEELDLSELESLLQEEPSESAPVTEDDDIELELDFDFQADENTEEMPPVAEESLGESDFSDIEAMLEKDDKPLDVAADLEGDIDLDLDLDLELDLAPEAEPSATAAAPAMAAAPVAERSEPTMELADIDETEPEPGAVSKAKASKTIASAGGRGSGLRIFLTILLVVSLLFAILVGIYAMRDEIRDRTGIAIPTIAAVEQARETVAALGIPGLSDWIRPAVKDVSGNLNLVTQDVSGRFVTSPTLGDLFVISGKVRNNYRTTRHSIALTGRLFTKDNREVQGKEFFAGNVMTDEELATLTMEQIDQRLKTALGNENVNARVRPGQLVPFMVVFAKLPDDLAEFAVEARSSQEGTAIK